MNLVTERSLKENVLGMLLRSSLLVAYWWLAVDCAVYLLNRLPTKTSLGYMSPYECVYGAAPDQKWLRIWGCKCDTLKPKADRRKGLDEISFFRIFSGIRYTEYGVLVFVPLLDKIIVSVHVVSNEIIFTSNDDYFAEQERLNINVASESRDPADYQFFVGMQQDGLVYETKCVTVSKGILRWVNLWMIPSIPVHIFSPG